MSGSQSMSDRPKRKWFQFHLSTLIAAVLCAGSVLGLNLVWQRADVKESGWVLAIKTAETLGWPYRLKMRVEFVCTDRTRPTLQALFKPYEKNGLAEPGREFHQTKLADGSDQFCATELCGNFRWCVGVNVATAVAVFFAVAVSMELIRRREARKTGTRRQRRA